MHLLFLVGHKFLNDWAAVALPHFSFLSCVCTLPNSSIWRRAPISSKQTYLCNVLSLSRTKILLCHSLVSYLFRLILEIQIMANCINAGYHIVLQSKQVIYSGFYQILELEWPPAIFFLRRMLWMSSYSGFSVHITCIFIILCIELENSLYVAWMCQYCSYYLYHIRKTLITYLWCLLKVVRPSSFVIAQFSGVMPGAGHIVLAWKNPPLLSVLTSSFAG